jgi:hypothetical protein
MCYTPPKLPLESTEIVDTILKQEKKGIVAG